MTTAFERIQVLHNTHIYSKDLFLKGFIFRRIYFSCPNERNLIVHIISFFFFDGMEFRLAPKQTNKWKKKKIIIILFFVHYLFETKLINL